MKQLLLNAYGIGKCFDGQQMLRDFWIELATGSVVGLCGMNQSGKTLAARILTGELTADSGKFFFAEHFYRDLEEAAEKLNHISRYMGRESLFFDDLSIADNYALLCKRPILGVILNREMREIEILFQEVNFKVKVNLLMRELPFGTREYCEILLEIFSGGKLIILDEKLDALYRWNSAVVRELLAIGKRKGVCFLIISNHLEMLQELSDEIAVIRRGCSIMQIKSPEFSREKLIRLMTGEDYEHSMEKKKEYMQIVGDQVVFEAVKFCLEEEDPKLDFSVRQGEIVGLLSLNNRWNQCVAEVFAGRTEHFFGMLRLGGLTLSRNSLLSMRNSRGKICVLPTPVWEELLFPCMSIEENLMLPSMQKMGIQPLGYVGKKLMRFARGQLREHGVLQETGGQIKPVEELDTVTAMRVVMERIRIYRPLVLVISEMTESADVRLREAVYQECRRCAERGIAVLIISSDVSEALSLCNRLVLVKERGFVGECCVIGTENQSELMSLL